MNIIHKLVSLSNNQIFNLQFGRKPNLYLRYFIPTTSYDRFGIMSVLIFFKSFFGLFVKFSSYAAFIDEHHRRLIHHTNIIYQPLQNHESFVDESFQFMAFAIKIAIIQSQIKRSTLRKVPICIARNECYGQTSSSVRERSLLMV